MPITLPRIYVPPAEFPACVSPLLKITRLFEGEELDDHESILAVIGDEVDAFQAAKKYEAYLEEQGDFIETGGDKDKRGEFLWTIRNCGDNCVKFYYGKYRHPEPTSYVLFSSRGRQPYYPPGR